MTLHCLLCSTDSPKGPFVSSSLSEIDFLKRIHDLPSKKETPRLTDDSEADLISLYGKYVRCFYLNDRLVTFIDTPASKPDEGNFFPPRLNKRDKYFVDV
jgi:hypothetical protein